MAAWYNVTYRVRDDDGEVHEEVIQVEAFSEAQAVFLSPCAPEDILFVECAVRRKRLGYKGDTL